MSNDRTPEEIMQLGMAFWGSKTFGLLMSLNMLIELHGGFDYTGADCSAWLREAGFCDIRVEHLAGPDSMVVGMKQVGP